MRVVIAEDTVFRNSIAEILQDGGHQVDYVARSGEELLAYLGRGEQPDVAVLDIRMPPTRTDEGLRTAERIRHRWPSVGILLLSAPLLVPMAIRLLALGGEAGLGYLSKDSVITGTELVTAAERVAAGGQSLDPELVDEMMRRRRRISLEELLTPRLLEVLRLIAEGLTNQAIADSLSVSVKTAEDYCSRVFERLGLAGSPNHNPRVLAVLEWFRNQE